MVVAAGGLPGQPPAATSIGPSRRWSGGRAVGQDDARGLRLAGLVLPADRDAVTGVVLPQRRLKLLRRRDALPVHRDDLVALGEAGPAAGVPATTPATLAPAPVWMPLAAALSADMICTPSSPVGPMCTVVEEVPASIWSAIDFAWLIGMAKACVCWPWNCVPCEAAVLMPMIWPAVLTSGPPESPGWIPALWWMSPVSCSDVPAPSSEAVIDAPRLAMWPVATAGVPPLPSALPSATTFWPEEALPESPRVTVCRPDAP